MVQHKIEYQGGDLNTAYVSIIYAHVKRVEEKPDYTLASMRCRYKIEKNDDVKLQAQSDTVYYCMKMSERYYCLELIEMFKKVGFQWTIVPIGYVQWMNDMGRNKAFQN